MASFTPTACNNSEDVCKQEEYNFFRLKHFILNYIIDQFRVSEDDISFALTKILDSFKSFSFHDIKLSEWSYACAYFHRFGAQGCGLTRFKVLEALQNCEDLALKFNQSNLNIVSLGGGPGNDIVGLTSALYESRIQSCLNITIVDSVEEWSTFVNALKIFIKKYDYGNSSKYFHQNRVDVSFLTATLSNYYEEKQDYHRVLEEADVILMIRLISSFRFEVRANVVEDVYKNMKSGALAIVIDAPLFVDHWTAPKILYVSNFGEEYGYFVPTNRYRKRFGHDDCGSTKAQIAVLKKI